MVIIKTPKCLFWIFSLYSHPILFDHSEIRLAVATSTTGWWRKMQRRESFLSSFQSVSFFPLIVFLLIPLFAFPPYLLICHSAFFIAFLLIRISFLIDCTHKICHKRIFTREQLFRFLIMDHLRFLKKKTRMGCVMWTVKIGRRRKSEEGKECEQLE